MTSTTPENLWTCKRCSHQSTSKCNLLKHLRRKVSCNDTNGSISIETYIDELIKKEYNDKTYNCKYCGTRFNSYQNRHRHYKTCKATKQQDNLTNDKSKETASDSNMVAPHMLELLKTMVAQEVTRQMQQYLANSRENSQLGTLLDCDAVAKPNLDTSPSKKTKTKINPAKRRLVWKTYIGMAHGEVPCLCCKSNNIDMLNFHCGHVVSDAQGGTTELSNLRPICSVCNSSMGAMDMRQFAKEQFGVDIV